MPLLQSYTAWRLLPDQDWDTNTFIFEIWLASTEDKTNLFESLKPFVDQYSGCVNWHECTHDERYKQPCIIAETYMVE